MEVTHTRTRDAYIARRGSPPTDIDGNEIDIGTSVQILDSPSRRSAPNGTIAVVRGWHREDYSFAALEVPNPHDDLHDCDGLCQAARGLWVQDNRFIKFDPLPDDKGADEAAKQMVTGLTDKSSVVIMGGRVFDLKLVENADLSKSFDTILEGCARQISAVIKRANAQERRLRAELKDIFQFPAFSLKHIQQGMQVCLWNGFLCYILPFNFAPRFVQPVDSTEAVLVISDEHQKRLKTNVFLAITLDKPGNIIHAGLFKDPQLTEPFIHYHGHGEDCLGSIRGRVARNPEEAISFRNKYQVVLQTVNMHSPLNKTCKNIGLEKLREDSRPMKEGETWRTRKLPHVKSLKEGAPPKVGDRVRVVGLVDALVTSELGRIGTIRNICGGGYPLQVEFDEPLHCGHDCSGYAPNGYGYNLPVNCVEIIEEEAEEAATTGSTTEPNASWQTDTSDPPADEPDEERI